MQHAPFLRKGRQSGAARFKDPSIITQMGRKPGAMLRCDPQISCMKNIILRPHASGIGEARPFGRGRILNGLWTNEFTSAARILQL